MDLGELDKCTLEATVVTGLEECAKEECQIKLSTKASVIRGRIIFDVPMNAVQQALLLRSVDNIYTVVHRVPKIDLSVDKENVFKHFQSLVSQMDWTDGLKVWRAVNEETTFTLQNLLTLRVPKVSQDVTEGDGDFDSKCSADEQRLLVVNEETEPVVAVSPEATTLSSDCAHEETVDVVKNGNSNGLVVDKIEEKDLVVTGTSTTVGDSAELAIEANPPDCPGSTSSTKSIHADISIPSFRVTCNRTGQKHKFTSMEAAAEFGGAIYDHFNWKVNMKNFDIEVVLNIDEESLTVCIALTRESLHKRNLRYFGPTALRPTIAYNILRLCSILPGDVVCDPLCGGGSLPIEAASSWPEAYHLCGDNHDAAWKRTEQNILAVNDQLKEKNEKLLQVGIARWDACRLPLRDASVDVFVTDLPFGKRIGSKTDNRHLYPKLLQEMARVCNTQNGRAILLTHDKANLGKNVTRLRHLWKQTRVIGVNIGGLTSCVFILRRTLVKV